MKNDKEKSVNDIEVVIGDNSVIEILEVGDCMNNIRPKYSEKNKKKLIIPKIKNKNDKNDKNE